MALSKFERNLLAVFQEEPQASYSVNELSKRFNYRGSKNFKRLIKALNFLEGIHQIQLTAHNKYQLAQSQDTVEGIFRAHDRGFGFISYDEDKSDLFVPPHRTNEAMEGDRVKARIIKEVDPQTGKGSEAEILSIVERASAQLVGEFFAYSPQQRQETGYLGYVIPNEKGSSRMTIFIEEGGIQPVDHSIVVVKIKEYPTTAQPDRMLGYVAKEIGHRDAPGVDILEILFKHSIPHEFPKQVIEEAEKIPSAVLEEEKEGRVDLREQAALTIDGADAKDLDDAIYLETLENGNYQLFVHIADVSHYVRVGTAIDAEALERGTSVYLTDRVVPMLPQRLSNGICSLLPNEDRLAMTCEMEINRKGRVVKRKIYPSLIQTKHRLTYEGVNAFYAEERELQEELKEIAPILLGMEELHQILYKKRQARGALDFDTGEAKIIVDDEGKPLDIHVRERGIGERLIESFMLVANETVAEFVEKKGLPLIYRIHEQPDPDRMERFAEFITSFGIILRGNTEHITPKQLQQALKEVKGEPYEEVVSMMMLRSMQQAKYDARPLGHYGLATQDYTHFTAPIRRYPDLMVHRLLHSYLEHTPAKAEINKLEEQLPDIAEHASRMERRAVDAERDTVALKMAEYMAERIGEEYEGRISSITSFGLFVRLPNSVEGLIALPALRDDYYIFNEHHLILIGERTGKILRIGQEITIRVAQVDIANREIDFDLLDVQPMDDSKTNYKELHEASVRAEKKKQARQKKSQRFKIKKKKKRRG